MWKWGVRKFKNFIIDRLPEKKTSLNKAPESALNGIGGFLECLGCEGAMR
jgi:hypothetical protein